MAEEQSFDFNRLQEEHAKALQASRESIEKWERFKGDYEVLQNRLATLPDRHTHDIMVPFGRFAFIPGQLYHSNEVTMLLGDNWFLKTTTKHAIEIVERRKKYVCEMLEKEQQTYSDWQSRQSFTEQFQSTVHEHDDVVEIKEEYVPRQPGTEKVRKAWVPKGDVPPPRKVLPPSSISRRAAEHSVREHVEATPTQATPPFRIRITHGEPSSPDSDVDSDDSNNPLYTNPGDIASHSIQQALDKPVTTKKKVKWGPNQYHEPESHDPPVQSHDPPVQSHDLPAAVRPKAAKPFTGQVIERSYPQSSMTFDPMSNP